MLKILVAEDDLALNALLSSRLRAEGYEVLSALDGEQALAFAEEHSPALLLSDIMMPKKDGYQLVSELRANGMELPVIFLTAKDDKPSKLYGYGLGVDDYVVKPFDTDELMLKISAVLRRAKIKNDKRVSIGNFTMDAEERTATLNGEEIPLTVREFDILFHLLSYPKKTFTRSHLMNEFWDYDSSATSRTVDVYMAKIREKTAGAEGFEIVTVHGMGYKAVLK